MAEERGREAVNARLPVICAVVLAGALAVAQPACAQRAPTIGVLSPFHSSLDVFRDAFQQRLKDLGYVAGRNIHLEYRSAEGMTDRLPQLANELVKLKVNAIVTTTAPGAQAAKQATALAALSSIVTRSLA